MLVMRVSLTAWMVNAYQWTSDVMGSWTARIRQVKLYVIVVLPHTRLPLMEMLFNADEVSCKVYEKDPSYIKTMPPEPLPGADMTLVHLGLDILAILEIAEVASYISMQIQLRLTWYLLL